MVYFTESVVGAIAFNWQLNGVSSCEKLVMNGEYHFSKCLSISKLTKFAFNFLSILTSESDLNIFTVFPSRATSKEFIN